MSRGRILVVEDEVVVAMDIQARLIALGYEVVGRADTAAGAVTAAERFRPDLVLMDVRLKGPVDGIAAAGEVRERFGIAVVFLTAHADEATLERAKQSDPFGYILKPLEDRELRTVLEMALYKRGADLEIRRLNRLYAVLSRVNRALVGVGSAPAFLEEVCRVAVEVGQYGFAWVGRYQESFEVLRTVAARGGGAATVDRVPELVADRGAGSRSHEAFRRGTRWVGSVPEPGGSPATSTVAVWQAGLREMAAIPVRSGGVIWGVFTVYSGSVGVFGTREVELLEEVAASIGFGLDQGVREEERAQAEDELRHREAELAAIYHSAPFMMCLVDRSGQVVRANRALARLGEADGLPVPAALARCLAVIGGRGAACPGGGGLLGEAVRETFLTGDGRLGVEMVLEGGILAAEEEVHVSVSTAPLEVGRTPLVLLCMEDISRRRRLEAQFLQAQKMEAVGQLAGGIAHDFNNILAAMLMNLGVVRNPARHDADPAEALTELERLAQRAADLVRQLLLFGRRQALQVSRLDLNVVLTGLTRMLRRLLGDHIEVTLACAPEPMWVDVDAGMIEQAVVNLALNARDAMAGGGRLQIGTSRVRFSEGVGGGSGVGRMGWFVCLRMADTGCGMDEAVLGRIFEPFFSTKETGKGTGLGLPTVQGIVGEHRGWIEVESRVGVGTVFLTYLPAAAGPPLQPVPDPFRREVEPEVRGGTETVLLVEDAPAVRRMVAMTLRSFGYRVLETSHGPEALERWSLESEGIDLVLTDMVMPGGMSGLDVIRWLRRQRPGLRAVVTSGYSTELVRPGDAGLDGVAYLAKPYRAEALARVVRESLDAGGLGRPDLVESDAVPGSAPASQ